MLQVFLGFLAYLINYYTPFTTIFKTLATALLTGIGYLIKVPKDMMVKRLYTRYTSFGFYRTD